MPAWLMRKVGPLPVWAWPAVLVGGFVVYRYVKAKQAAAGGASSGTAVPIGGSPFSFPDNSQPDAGNLLPTSSLPTSATTSTNGGTSANTPPLNPNLINGTGLTNRTTGTGTPAPAPRVNYYGSPAPISATSTTAGTGPGGQTRVHL